MPRTRRTSTAKPKAAAKPRSTRKKVTDGGVAQVRAKGEAETAQGFAGDEVDQTPNENYTVAGVLAGKPTPETASAGKESS